MSPRCPFSWVEEPTPIQKRRSGRFHFPIHPFPPRSNILGTDINLSNVSSFFTGVSSRKTQVSTSSHGPTPQPENRHNESTTGLSTYTHTHLYRHTHTFPVKNFYKDRPGKGSTVTRASRPTTESFWGFRDTRTPRLLKSTST